LNKKEYFTNENKNCLICYYGGGFRDGNMESTTQDTDDGYKNQEYASKTHIKLHNILKEKHINYDIIINTYDSKYIDKLTEWYKPDELIINKINKTIKSTDGRDNLITEICKKINKEYDFILFIRIDLFLKPDFYKVLNFDSNKIKFLAHHYDPKNCHSYSKNGDPVIVDLFLYIPKKYNYILDNNFYLMHDSWEYYKKTYHLTDNDMGFMTTLMFDANTYKDLNPYYVISGRPENKKIHNELKDNSNNYGLYEYTQFDTCQKYHIDDVLPEELTQNPCQYYYNKNKDFYILN
jgi:hypothetical protein